MVQNHPIRGFLFLYICLLGYQLAAANTISVQMWLAFFAGFIAAVFAHKRAGILALVALITHMSIECYYHAKHGFVYDTVTAVFHFVHIVFDLIFLTYQTREVTRKYFAVTISSVIGVLLLVGLTAYQPAAVSFSPFWQPQNHVHPPSIWQFAILGGIIGCVLMHGLSMKSNAA